MTNEKGQEVYRKLLYFFENNLKVHFKDLDKIFYNGIIIDLNESKLTLVLRERVRGTIPILLECINPNSIEEFKEVGE
ncbi:hypothetical protein LCGC14_1371170 [marine sediment metagenome]|uniref:Uncharacterized protein n=1 Tax=marine sediment metagenome TaxID=412755 RepID=A0A0F9MKM0_9ZZZZ